MDHSIRAPRFNRVNNKNYEISTLPSQVLIHSGQQRQVNKKCVNNQNEMHLGSYKRTLNLQANNIHNNYPHTVTKISSPFQNFVENGEQNLSSGCLNYKYDPRINTKKYTNSKTNLQNQKSIAKSILETKNSSYKKCGKISKLQHKVEENKQELNNNLSNRLVKSLCRHGPDKKPDEVSISNDDKTENENIMQHKDNGEKGKFDEHLEEFIYGCTKETREKTPMCLVNDLARFNKIPFQYRLTSEHGPAHCKRFTVTLKLGDEEYTAEGFKIKKAQHLAAKEAIEKTKYKHPTPKANRRNDNEVTKINITPTVELNALAMKLGQQTYYIFDPKQMLLPENSINSESPQITKVISKYNVNQNRQPLNKCEILYSKLQQSIRTNKFNQLSALETSYNSNSAPCKITLIVGNQKFFGIGKTPQQAKHDAATNALQVLKDQMSRNQLETHIESLDGNEQKSPISLVFEIGIKRNLPVDFKVLREEGPAHMRIFTTACIVGSIITEGEGTGKKLSKKKAAQKMLEELKKLPPLSSETSPLKRSKIKTSSKKVNISKNSVTNCKTNKKNILETDSPNPVTKVLEWHQNNKEKEPEFKLISEPGKEYSRRRQFVMEISSNKIIARGIGNSKKLAKHHAAQNFLNALNMNNEVLSKKNERVHSTQSDCSSGEKCTTKEQDKSNLSSEGKTILANIKEQNVEERSDNSIKKSDFFTETQSTKSLKLKNTVSKSSGLHMKDQLLYLANLLGFEVDFSDYPKGNHNEYLTIVMLSTNPPQICHGVGINSKESQEDASKNALKILSEMGLNNATKS